MWYRIGPDIVNSLLVVGKDVISLLNPTSFAVPCPLCTDLGLRPTQTSTMTNIQEPAIPEGLTVLVTGVNGFIGSHVADQFLRSGFRVRGTARDIKKSAWIKDFFERTYGDGQFELVAVPDRAVEAAFATAVEGLWLSLYLATRGRVANQG